MIIADHGNCEEMFTAEGKASTAHSTNPVPLIYIGREATIEHGGLADVAPTLLSLMGLSIPQEMTGKILIHPQGVHA